ncbi:hypothetical protein [Flavobacterium sp. HTF]|uniref:hypothetical protein n=1 Tax=Flavobacterium sp. HTF TaxID=2170732 RepID=UPI000F4D6647|nr:hypothetical protein [Flavobacterium sp. HTF]
MKTKRYTLFYGNGKTTNTNGNIEDESFEGDYSKISDAYLSLGMATISNPTIWGYIWDTKKKDFISYTGNFSEFSQ